MIVRVLLYSNTAVRDRVPHERFHAQAHPISSTYRTAVDTSHLISQQSRPALLADECSQQSRPALLADEVACAGDPLAPLGRYLLYCESRWCWCLHPLLSSQCCWPAKRHVAATSAVANAHH
jgi:hypothetical protein